MHLITVKNTHTYVVSPLEEKSALSKNVYLTTRNIQRRQTSMLPAGFEPAIPASERPKTHALNRAYIGIGVLNF